MNQYLTGLTQEPSFSKKKLFDAVKKDRPDISHSAFYRLVKKMLVNGEIIRIGRDTYCVPGKRLSRYRHIYREQAKDLADYMITHYPEIDFRIFETVQLNDFLNHLIGRNVIFLSVEEDLGDFIFEELRERYDNNVLLNPSKEIYHRYWKENMIVIEKMPTEAPKGKSEYWNTDLEKMLVDIMADRLMRDTFSESEYPTIYETAFGDYIIDESQMFRYAKRRKMNERMLNYLREHTSVELRMG